MNHINNVTVFRAMALLLVMASHMDYPNIPNRWLSLIVMLGGEIGVTAFFVLSGFGIYSHLLRNPVDDITSYAGYLRKRLKRIIPQYYLCIVVVTMLMNAWFLSAKDGWISIITHLFFVHNFFLAHNGSINGVLWTMAVIFQFYLLAPFLYKIIEKIPMIVTMIGISVITFGVRYVHMALTSADYYWYVNRCFISSTLDNFVIGMLAARIYYMIYRGHSNKCIWRPILVLATACVAMLQYCRLGTYYGICTFNISGGEWHTGLSVLLGVVLVTLALLPPMTNPIYRAVLWIGNHEYGIYIWHLLIIQNLLNTSEPFRNYRDSNSIIAFLIVLVISGVIGYISEMFDKSVVDHWTAVKRAFSIKHPQAADQ